MKARRLYLIRQQCARGLLTVVLAYLTAYFNLAHSEFLLIQNQATLTVTVAATPHSRARGLSQRATLPAQSGMLFDFERDAKHAMWMKDMCFAIDIAWLNADGVVVDIRRNVSPETYPEAFRPTQAARYVVETNANAELKRGARATCATRDKDGRVRRYASCAQAIADWPLSPPAPPQACETRDTLAQANANRETNQAAGQGASQDDRLTLTEGVLRIGQRDWTVKLPKSCRVDALAKMTSPRLFTFANKKNRGDLIVGSASGYIYHVAPPYQSARVIATLTGYPHSVDVNGERLLIAKTSGLYYAPWSDSLLDAGFTDKDLKLIAKLPGGMGHRSRSVAVGPDKRIYLSLGITGNCSDEYIDESYPFDDRRGGVMRWDGRQWVAHATGLRNPVGFAWHPQTQVMYATNNGPDHLGYDQPPEYFSRLEPGSFHGMPWFQFDGQAIQRDTCARRAPPRTDAVAPEVTFAARSAPMGVAFVTTENWLKGRYGDAVVAVHGSWATQPDGGFIGSKASRRAPSLQLVRFANGRATRRETLLGGLQDANGDRLIRPVGVGFASDGALYFTSDGGRYTGLLRMRCD